MEKHNMKTKTNYRQALEEKHINTEKYVNKQTKMRRANKNMISKNYITQNIRSMNIYNIYNFKLMSVNMYRAIGLVLDSIHRLVCGRQKTTIVRILLSISV
jgi:hypothetical protein